MYDPEFYSRIKQGTLSDAIKLFAVLGSIGIAISLIVAFNVVVPFAFSDFPTELKAAYPDDLIVQIADGKMSINRPQPYYVENKLVDTQHTKYMAIFDGTDALSPDLEANSTYFMVKESSVIAYGQNHMQQIIPLSRLGTTTMDKAMVVEFVNKFEPYFTPAVLCGAAFMFVIFTLFGTIFWVAIHMIYVLIPAVVVWLLGMLRGDNLTYRESYMVTLYATVPVAIIAFILAFVFFGSALPQFVYSLVVLFVAIINLPVPRKG